MPVKPLECSVLDDSLPANLSFGDSTLNQAIYSQLSDARTRAAMCAQWTDNLGVAVPADGLLASVGVAAAASADLFDSGDATLGDLVRIGIGETDYPVGGITLAPLTGSECLAKAG